MPGVPCGRAGLAAGTSCHRRARAPRPCVRPARRRLRSTNSGQRSPGRAGPPVSPPPRIPGGSPPRPPAGAPGGSSARRHLPFWVATGRSAREATRELGGLDLATGRRPGGGRGAAARCTDAETAARPRGPGWHPRRLAPGTESRNVPRKGHTDNCAERIRPGTDLQPLGIQGSTRRPPAGLGLGGGPRAAGLGSRQGWDSPRSGGGDCGGFRSLQAHCARREPARSPISRRPRPGPPPGPPATEPLQM